MKPSQKYQALMQQAGFVADDAQRQAVALLDDLHADIVDRQPRGWWRKLYPGRNRPSAVSGIYFWGGVGRGKTLLLDLFFQSLPEHVSAERVHFHGFMNRIHHELKRHRNSSGPLQRVAADIARGVRILCLDEFVIIDIGDAMIMAGLLTALFEADVVLVTTSNAAPQDLYRDGLQRARFLPAIDLISRRCQVFNLDGERDYRLRFLQQTDLYSVPHSAAIESTIRHYLNEHVTPVQGKQHELKINGRILTHRHCAEDTVWFGFDELCETNRSQNDYLELARLFSTLILTDIRQMGKARDDVARRFVLLVDVLYDHHVKLICSAAVPPDQLYTGKRLQFEFERTVSRLLEMQSSEYLGGAHTAQ